MEDEREVTPGGSEVFRHEEPAEPASLASDAPVLDVVQAHVEQHIGPVEMVFHELVSPYVHVDVLHVPPTEERQIHTLVTCGMSAAPMTVPDPGFPRFAELMVGLLPEWRLGEEDLKDERWYWPVRLLKVLARLPHEYATFLDVGHTIPNDDPPQPYAPGTELCGAILLRPSLAPDEFEVLHRPEGDIHFFGVVPLYAHEMDLKLQSGAEALLDAWEAAGLDVHEGVDPQRPPLKRRKRFGLL